MGALARTSFLVVAVLAALFARALPANAQCTSNASSCVTCHETQGLRPVLQSVQRWHVDHGFGDLCASCHAGDPAAPEKARAHAGLRDPLADPSVTCAGCHTQDAAARAGRYVALAASAATRASAPQTQPPGASPSGSSAAAPGASSPGAPSVSSSVAPSRSSPVASSASSPAELVLVALAVLLALALAYVLRRRSAQAARRPLLAWLRDKTWSPYAAGALLGLVVAFSAVVCGRPIAVSGAFDKLAAYAGRAFFPSSQYYGHIMSPGITWQVWLVVGLLVGSFASSKLSGEARLRWLPDTQWEPRFGASRALRAAIAFSGAVLVQLGAGIAGGCTSGLAISGGAVLSPAAFLFMAGMFGGGIPAAWLWYRGSKS